MRNVRLWRGLLAVDQRTVIEEIEFEEHDADGDGDTLVVARVRPRSDCLTALWSLWAAGAVSTTAGRGSAVAGSGLGHRAGRVGGRRSAWSCPEHGPAVIAVPWARHRAGHTLAFDATVAWLAVACSKTAVCELMRIAWRTVGAVVARVQTNAENCCGTASPVCAVSVSTRSPTSSTAGADDWCIDHDTRAAAVGPPRPEQSHPAGFFDALGDQRAAQITHVSADAAEWIAAVITERCQAAVLCADPFHVVAWATKPWTPNGAGPGTTPERWPAPNPAGGRAGLPGTPHPGRPGNEPAGSRVPATPCGRTPRTSPKARTPSWPGSPRPIPDCTAPICSKKACAMSSPSKERKASKPWTGAFLLGAALRYPGLRRVALESVKTTRHSIDAALEHGLSQGLIESTSTKSACSPGSRSDSDPQKHSSPWPCSPSAATAHYPAENPPTDKSEEPEFESS